MIYPFVTFFIIYFSIYLNAQWAWQNPLPQGNTLKDIKFLNTSIASAAYRNALRLNPDYALAYFNLGLLVEQLKNGMELNGTE